MSQLEDNFRTETNLTCAFPGRPVAFDHVTGKSAEVLVLDRGGTLTNLIDSEQVLSRTLRPSCQESTIRERIATLGHPSVAGSEVTIKVGVLVPENDQRKRKTFPFQTPFAN